MAKLRWVIACQRALIDQINNITLVQVLEEFAFPAPPANKPVPVGALIPFQFAIVTYWMRQDKRKSAKHKARVRFISPAGKQFAVATFEVDLTRHERARGTVDVPGVVYHGPGIYTVRVDLEVGRRWRNVGETEFNLHHNVQVPAPSR